MINIRTLLGITAWLHRKRRERTKPRARAYKRTLAQMAESLSLTESPVIVRQREEARAYASSVRSRGEQLRELEQMVKGK